MFCAIFSPTCIQRYVQSEEKHPEEVVTSAPNSIHQLNMKANQFWAIWSFIDNMGNRCQQMKTVKENEQEVKIKLTKYILLEFREFNIQ